MKDPHNYRAVGWSMVVVAASLAVIGLLVLALYDEPFFSDTIMKNKEKEFEERKKLEMESELGGTEFNASVNSLVFKNIL
ncbi:MAG: hypothetical protein O6761_07185 [Thaumarchaeota archaeon]|nr:MAG: hypothetical protein NPMRIOTA_150030 [Nitrosopumilales archaeon]MCZ6582939.1 hypothetical protein [Nitrososphaerota archaeon]